MRYQIAKEVKDEILAKASAGKKVVDLADQYGISSRTIYGWLRTGTGILDICV